MALNIRPLSKLAVGEEFEGGYYRTGMSIEVHEGSRAESTYKLSEKLEFIDISEDPIIASGHYDQELINYAKKFDLILLDLDDVIFTSTQFLCSSQWYGAYHKRYQLSYSKDKLIKDFYKCLDSTKYKPVSQELIDGFTSSFEQDKKKFALTARHINFSDETIKQLNSVDMQFTDYTVESSNLKKGIIFAGYDPLTAKPNNKGKILRDLIKKGIFGEVKSIIFVDDSMRNLEEVKAEVAKDFDFVGIHYTEVKDTLLNQYSEEELQLMSDFQWNSFNKNNVIPSNEEYILMKNNDL